MVWQIRILNYFEMYYLYIYIASSLFSNTKSIFHFFISALCAFKCMGFWGFGVLGFWGSSYAFGG